MNIKDTFDPKLPKGLTNRNLYSTFHDTREIPKIEMALQKNKVRAEVEFKFYYDKRKNKQVDKKEIITRNISGPSEEVYSVAAKLASRISLTLSARFNEEWQRTMTHLLNKPSENKSILNLGVYKQASYDIYDISSPAYLLNKKLSESDIKQKDLAYLAGVDETTLWRHLKGTADISRDAALKYAKVLGCDPAEILFNDLMVPVWGSTDTTEGSSNNRLQIFASEIVADETLADVKCPREIYRPDVRAIKFNSISHLDDHVAFYYNSSEPVVFEDQLVVVGTKLKNFHDNQIRNRFFIGIYKKNRNGKTVDIHTIDPSAIDVSGIEPDEDFNSFDDVVALEESMKTVIEDITPTFVAPVVSIIDNSKIYNPYKKEILKAYQELYTVSRKEDKKAIDQHSSAKILQEIKQRLKDDDQDDYYEIMEDKKIEALIEADKKLQSIISKAAYGPAKVEKKINIKDEAKKIALELTEKEEQIVREAQDRLLEKFDTPTPEDEDYIHNA